VRKLKWSIHCKRGRRISPLAFCPKLRNLGELDALAIEVYSKHEDCSEKYLEAFSPPPSSNVYFAFVNSLIDEPDLDALGRMYAQYIRKNPKVVKVGFHCTQYCYRDSESDLRDYLWNLTRDNAWICFIRKNPAATLRSLLQGRKSPTVLYFALRQRISELEEYF